MSDHQTIPLQNGILYGPVLSRRLGRSLGLNILPSEIKVCSMDCRYCQYSWTGILSIRPEHFGGFLPSRDEVREALERELADLAREGTPPDTITFSGNGEATLHPDFPAIVSDVAALRDRYAPECRTAVLSNSTTVHRGDIREALALLDDPILKLDAARRETFERLNGPALGVDFNDLIGGLRAMGGNLIIQSLFVHGSVNNATDEELAELIPVLTSIHPRSVQVYTLDRGPADRSLAPVPRDRLRAIAAALRGAGLEADTYE